jgi:alanine dehydrogenase
MIFGVPKEALLHEHRVGLTPYAVSYLINRGQQVYVQHDAGRDSHFTNEDYSAAGAQIVYSAEEVFGRADIVCKVSVLGGHEVEMLRPGSIVCGFMHLAVMQRDLIDRIAEREVTTIGWEVLEQGGRRPVMTGLSEIAGQLVVHTGASLLQFEPGGRGIVLGSVPGVPPATVVILGAGTVGRVAAFHAASAGAHVIVLDAEVERLRETLEYCRPHDIVTFLASQRNLARNTAIADMVVGAVNIPGGRSPRIVTEEMVQGMKQGSVILDLSIDEGGCVATSRPTTPDNPCYQTHGVTHFCVPNMTTNVPRTASRALTISALPYAARIAVDGLDHCLAADPGLARGVYTYRGKLVHEIAASALDMPASKLSDLLPSKNSR